MNNNDTIRRIFLEYYEKNYHPNLGMIGNEIGLSRVSLQQFKNGKNLSDDSLKKIKKFLDKQMVR